MLDSKNIEKFEESLGNFLENGNNEILTWFLDIDAKYNSSLLDSEIIRTKLANSLSILGNQDDKIFEKIINSASEKNLKKIGNMLADLINVANPQQSTTFLKVFQQKRAELPNEINNPIEDKLNKTVMQLDYPDNISMLETVIMMASGTVYDRLKPLAEKINSWLTRGDINQAKEAIRLLELINNKATPIEPFGIQEAINRAETLLEENNVEFSVILLEFILKDHEHLSPKFVKQVAELIRVQLTVEKSEPIRNVGFKFASNLIEKGKRYGILEQVLDLAKSAKEPDTQQQCKNLLINYKQKLSSDEKEEAVSLFGENVFDETPDS